MHAIPTSSGCLRVCVYVGVCTCTSARTICSCVLFSRPAAACRMGTASQMHMHTRIRVRVRASTRTFQSRERQRTKAEYSNCRRTAADVQRTYTCNQHIFTAHLHMNLPHTCCIRYSLEKGTTIKVQAQAPTVDSGWHMGEFNGHSGGLVLNACVGACVCASGGKTCLRRHSGHCKVHVRARMRVCMHACMYACMHVCMYACMYV